LNIIGRDNIYDKDIFFNRVEGRNIVSNYANRIGIINNFGATTVHSQYYSKSPDQHEVERCTNRTITPASIHQVNNSMVAKHNANEIQVYRPTVIHPQPREFRRVDKSDQNPVLYNEGSVNNGGSQQRQNVENLPVRRAPQSSYANNEEEILEERVAGINR
jgi:hypothetical protein